MHVGASVAPFDVAGLRIIPLPVMHGADYVCHGFGAGERGGRMVYISDYTELLPQVLTALFEYIARNHRYLFIQIGFVYTWEVNLRSSIIYIYIYTYTTSAMGSEPENAVAGCLHFGLHGAAPAGVH